MEFEGAFSTLTLPSFRYGIDKIDLVGYMPRNLVYHDGDMSLVRGDYQEFVFWAVHETKKSAYNSGFVQDHDLKAGEALLVQFVWDGTMQTYLHLDRDTTSEEDTINAGYDAGEALWNRTEDRLERFPFMLDRTRMM